jgi:hypothetical protein
MPTAFIHPVSLDSPFTSSVLRSDGIVSDPSRRPPRPPGMKSGDVLVSRPTARTDVYDISVVPAVARMSDLRYEDGKEAGRQLAHRLAVDGWVHLRSHPFFAYRDIPNVERFVCVCAGDHLELTRWRSHDTQGHARDWVEGMRAVSEGQPAGRSEISAGPGRSPKFRSLAATGTSSLRHATGTSLR